MMIRCYFVFLTIVLSSSDGARTDRRYEIGFDELPHGNFGKKLVVKKPPKKSGVEKGYREDVKTQDLKGVERLNEDQLQQVIGPIKHIKEYLEFLDGQTGNRSEFLDPYQLDGELRYGKNDRTSGHKLRKAHGQTIVTKDTSKRGQHTYTTNRKLKVHGTNNRNIGLADDGITIKTCCYENVSHRVTSDRINVVKGETNKYQNRFGSVPPNGDKNELRAHKKRRRGRAKYGEIIRVVDKNDRGRPKAFVKKDANSVTIEGDRGVRRTYETSEVRKSGYVKESDAEKATDKHTNYARGKGSKQSYGNVQDQHANWDKMAKYKVKDYETSAQIGQVDVRMKSQPDYDKNQHLKDLREVDRWRLDIKQFGQNQEFKYGKTPREQKKQTASEDKYKTKVKDKDVLYANPQQMNIKGQSQRQTYQRDRGSGYISKKSIDKHEVHYTMLQEKNKNKGNQHQIYQHGRVSGYINNIPTGNQDISYSKSKKRDFMRKLHRQMRQHGRDSGYIGNIPTVNQEVRYTKSQQTNVKKQGQMYQHGSGSGYIRNTPTVNRKVSYSKSQQMDVNKYQHQIYQRGRDSGYTSNKARSGKKQEVSYTKSQQKNVKRQNHSLRYQHATGSAYIRNIPTKNQEISYTKSNERNFKKKNHQETIQHGRDSGYSKNVPTRYPGYITSQERYDERQKQQLDRGIGSGSKSQQRNYQKQKQQQIYQHGKSSAYVRNVPTKKQGILYRKSQETNKKRNEHLVYQSGGSSGYTSDIPKSSQKVGYTKSQQRDVKRQNHDQRYQRGSSYIGNMPTRNPHVGYTKSQERNIKRQNHQHGKSSGYTSNIPKRSQEVGYINSQLNNVKRQNDQQMYQRGMSGSSDIRNVPTKSPHVGYAGKSQERNSGKRQNHQETYQHGKSSGYNRNIPARNQVSYTKSQQRNDKRQMQEHMYQDGRGRGYSGNIPASEHEVSHTKSHQRNIKRQYQHQMSQTSKGRVYDTSISQLEVNKQRSINRPQHRVNPWYIKDDEGTLRRIEAPSKTNGLHRRTENFQNGGSQSQHNRKFTKSPYGSKDAKLPHRDNIKTKSNKPNYKLASVVENIGKNERSTSSRYEDDDRSVHSIYQTHPDGGYSRIYQYISKSH